MDHIRPSLIPPEWSDQALADKAFAIAQQFNAFGLTLATAESCTGGWIAKVCTDLAGSSNWFECGWVTYSNQAKHHQIGVRHATLEQFGAVSEMVAAEMAAGAKSNANTQYALAVTGIAGPTGGSAQKPVGTVCFGWVGPDQEPETETCLFETGQDGQSGRELIRRATVAYALDGLLQRIA